MSDNNWRAEPWPKLKDGDFIEVSHGTIYTTGVMIRYSAFDTELSGMFAGYRVDVDAPLVMCKYARPYKGGRK